MGQQDRVAPGRNEPTAPSQQQGPKRYRSNIRLHILPDLGKAKLSKLQPHQIQRLYGTKRRTMSPASVRLVHGILSAALKQAVAWRLIATNPCDLTKRPKPTAEEIRPLTAEQAQA